MMANLDYLPLTLYVDYLNTPSKGDEIDSLGIALLGEFKFNDKFSIGGRIEYVNNDGDGDSDNYGIGKGNNAWTFTVTPKYRISKYFYVRGEISYVTLGNKNYQKDSDNANSLTDNLRLGVEITFVF